MISVPRPLLSAFLLTLLCSVPLRAELSLLSGVSIPGGGEVVAHYNPASGVDRVLVTNSLARTTGVSHRVDIYSLAATGVLALEVVADFDPIFGASATLSVSSVAADPLGRGFGVASIIPKDNTTVLGKVAFFDLHTGAVLRVVDVGFHPDAVRFTPDGRRVIVANEGEYTAGAAQAPGSISIVNLTGFNASTDLQLRAPLVATVDFRDGLAPGVSLDSLRFNVTGVPAAERYLHVEPEFPVATNERAYVTLQENNAIAVVDLEGGAAPRISAILPLGTITQRIDASDRDPTNGGLAAININDVVPGLPMPDTIATFLHNGRRLLATANEGDARSDDGDVARAGAANVVDTVADGPDDRIFSGSLSDSAGIGRLTISRVDGNLDGDSLVEVPTMIGTRSFTLWSEDGQRVFDSGSMIEEFVRANAPRTFNMNNGTTTAIDTRSDDKGPEPEALAYGQIDGRHYVFVGAERQNGIFQFDVTDLSRVSIVGYFNIVDGVKVVTGTQYVSPETIVFVSASDSPTGKPILLVGYEGVEPAISGSLAVLEVQPTTTRLVNGSVRTTVAAGQTMIVGFSPEGASSVLMRAVGPGLSQFGVPGVLVDPLLFLYSPTRLLESNEDWVATPELQTATASVGAFALPAGSRDSVILRSLTGGHSLNLAARAAGDVMLEVYSVGAGAGLRNFSTRGRVGAVGDRLIAGFVILGQGAHPVLIRAVGPKLAAFGITSASADPRLEVYRNGVRAADNDDWMQAVSAADLAAAGAFPLDGDTKSAAVRLSLTGGAAYTVEVFGAGSPGEVLLEVYQAR
jgi:sugar lactone lactonase YvrE